MSGIVGSRHNIRGSGLVGSLGTDGQIFTSSGAGAGAVFEDAAGGGAWNLISTFTSDGSDATASFTSGIDSTYKQYVFVFLNIHPETDDVVFTFQVSTDTGSSYGVANTAVGQVAWSDEAQTNSGGSATEGGVGNSTNFFYLVNNQGNDADQSASGMLRIYDPAAGATYHTHWEGHAVNSYQSDFMRSNLYSGYFHGGAAIDAVQFKMSSGEIQGGVIKMYGIS